MAGEIIKQEGVSGFVSVATGVSLSAGVFSQVSASNTIKSLMAASEEDYPEFDVLIQVTTGTPAENDQLLVHVRPKADGTNESPAPSGGYAAHYLGSVTLDNLGSSYYYGFGFPNKDKEGTFYLKSPTAITVSMSIRMRSVNTAA